MGVEQVIFYEVHDCVCVKMCKKVEYVKKKVMQFFVINRCVFGLANIIRVITDLVSNNVVNTIKPAKKKDTYTQNFAVTCLL